MVQDVQVRRTRPLAVCHPEGLCDRQTRRALRRQENNSCSRLEGYRRRQPNLFGTKLARFHPKWE